MRGLLVLAALTALMVHPVRAAENAAVETLPESSPAVEEEIIAVPSLDDEIVGGLILLWRLLRKFMPQKTRNSPACADSRLKELVLAKVHEYHEASIRYPAFWKNAVRLCSIKNVQQFMLRFRRKDLPLNKTFNVANKPLMVKNQQRAG